MIDLLLQGVAACITSADTTGALALLQEHQLTFSDPIEGVSFHAQALYYAIKNANTEVLGYLLSIPVLSDISFLIFRRPNSEPVTN